MRVAVLVLAAGRSSRMGEANKLLATFEGVPLVRRSVLAALASRAARTLVVTGHQRLQVKSAIDDLGVSVRENERYAEGLSTSLKLGFAECVDGDGVLVMLADHPFLTADHLDRLIAAFEAADGAAIVIATAEGRHGNPVVLPVRFADEIAAIEGDRGARGIVEANEALVVPVEIGQAARFDVDTPERMRAAGGILASAPLPHPD